MCDKARQMPDKPKVSDHFRRVFGKIQQFSVKLNGFAVNSLANHWKYGPKQGISRVLWAISGQNLTYVWFSAMFAGQIAGLTGHSQGLWPKRPLKPANLRLVGPKQRNWAETTRKEAFSFGTQGIVHETTCGSALRSRVFIFFCWRP